MNSFGTAVFLVAMLALVGCERSSSPNAAGSEAERQLDYVADLHIGDALDDPDAAFGNVGGLTVDTAGRIYVADVMEHRIKVFGPDGRFAFAIGREGAGPGELQMPCCLAFDDQGRLWVRDGGNQRYTAYRVGDLAASYATQRLMRHGDFNRFATLTFDDEQVIDIGTRADSSGENAVFRMTLDSTGAIVRDIQVPNVPAESTGVKKVSRGTADSNVTFYVYQPYGPSQLVAHSRIGEWAHATSSRYAINWRQVDGTLIRHVTGDVTNGPAISARERGVADKQMAADRKRTGANPGFTIPAEKPPLRNLYFDALGRLWVELAVADGGNRRAHIYDRSGKRIATAEWPKEVTLTDGAVRGDTAWGVGTDSLGVQTVVRLKAGVRR